MERRSRNIRLLLEAKEGGLFLVWKQANTVCHAKGGGGGGGGRGGRRRWLFETANDSSHVYSYALMHDTNERRRVGKDITLQTNCCVQLCKPCNSSRIFSFFPALLLGAS